MLYDTRKSSCVNARGIPTAAYQVLHLLPEVGYPPLEYPPSQVWEGYPPSQVWQGGRVVTQGGVPPCQSTSPARSDRGGTRGGVSPSQVRRGVPEVGYKKVLLCERKRHTDRSVSSTPSARSERGIPQPGLTGGWGVVTQGGVPPCQVWQRQYPRWGTSQPGPMGGTWGGVPPVGYPLVGVPPPARSDGGYPRWGTPPAGWTWLGYPPPPQVWTDKVKLLPPVSYYVRGR